MIKSEIAGSLTAVHTDSLLKAFDAKFASINTFYLKSKM